MTSPQPPFSAPERMSAQPVFGPEGGWGEAASAAPADQIVDLVRIRGPRFHLNASRDVAHAPAVISRLCAFPAFGGAPNLARRHRCSWSGILFRVTQAR